MLNLPVPKPVGSPIRAMGWVSPLVWRKKMPRALALVTLPVPGWRVLPGVVHGGDAEAGKGEAWQCGGHGVACAGESGLLVCVCEHYGLCLIGEEDERSEPAARECAAPLAGRVFAGEKGDDGFDGLAVNDLAFAEDEPQRAVALFQPNAEVAAGGRGELGKDGDVFLVDVHGFECLELRAAEGLHACGIRGDVAGAGWHRW